MTTLRLTNGFRHHIRYVLPGCLLLWLTGGSAAAAAIDSEREAPSYLKGALIINASDLKEMRADMPDLVIIDTRDAPALESTIRGAIRLTDRETTPSRLISMIPDKQTPVVFFGESARAINSFKAARKTINYGYVNVFWMRGGIEEWNAKGYPLEASQQ